MALLVLTTFDTPENGRSWMTDKTLEGISRTVNLNTHRLVVVDNGSCFETTETLKKWSRRLGGEPKVKVIYNLVNAGQARAINEGWSTARPGEVLARIDNDILLRTEGWLDRLEWCILRDPKVGIAAAKRDDIVDSPNRPEGCWSKTSLRMLSHEKGQSWIAVEDVRETLGSVQAINPALFEKIGYLDCFALYGLEDHAYAVRAALAGFTSCYVCGIDIKHLDDADAQTKYNKWKRELSGKTMPKMDSIVSEYQSGKRGLYVSVDGES